MIDTCTNKIFVDTGAWFATIVTADQHHHDATQRYSTLLRDDTQFVTTNLVVHETIMLLSRRESKGKAFEFLEKIYDDPKVEIMSLDSQIEADAYEIFRKYSDQNFSIVDCVSFSIMRRERIKRAFAFDQHFRIIGFELV